MKRLEAAWALYRAQVIPADAGKVQVKEARRAFYAGAQAMLNEQITMLDLSTEITEADLRKMDELDHELKQFATDVQRGMA